MVAISALNQYLSEVRQWEVMQLPDVKGALTRLRALIPRLRGVTIDPAFTDGNAAQYHTGSGVLNLNGVSPRTGDVIHEMVHAHNDLNSTGFTAPRDDDGMAYAAEGTLETLEAFRVFEDKLKRPGVSCEAFDKFAKHHWPWVWLSRHRPSQFAGRYGVFKTPFACNDQDFLRIQRQLGLKIGCIKIAGLLNRMAKDAGCGCLTFSCRPNGPLGNVAYAGSVIDPYFQ